jgi:M6 family metalloprotease-like protein
MRFLTQVRKLWVINGLVAALLMLSVTVVAANDIYPDPPPDFPVIDDSYPHGNLLSPLGGQTDRYLLVLYVEFNDLPYEIADVPPDPKFDGLTHMTAWGVHQQYFGDFPSVRGYFEEVSDGRLMLEPAPVLDGANEDGVDGVVQISMDKDREEFVGSDSEEMERLTELASEYVDFSQFANDDGVITELELSVVRHDTDNRLVPAGGGLVRNGMRPGFVVDGVSFAGVGSFDTPSIYSYVLVRTSTNLMTIVHELGHQLFDMPDSYFQEIGQRTDIGGHTATVPYNQLWRPNAWHYMHLGWSEPTVVTRSGYYDVPRDPAGSSFILYDPDKGTDNYFIIENRAPIAGTYDQGVGGTGLMIWRVDESAYLAVGESGWLELISPGAVDAPPWVWSGSPQERTVDGLTWLDETPANIAVRAISPAGDTMRMYFDVRGPGVLVDPLRTPTGQTIVHDVTPGVETEIQVPVMNTGEETDTFQVFFEGPDDWGTVPYEIELEAGEEADAFPAIIPTSDAPVEIFDLTVVAQSTTDSSVSENAPVTVAVVLDRTSIEYTGETYVPIDHPAGFEVLVTNIDDGNAPVSGVEVTFELSGSGGDLTATATTGQDGVAQANPIINLPPGDYQVTASTDRFGRHQASSTTVDYRIPTVEERIQDLLDALVDADLQRGIENSLTSTLGNALRHLENDRSTPACNVLGAFGNQVDAQDGKHIPEIDAEPFRDDVTGIQNQLGC